MVINVIGGILVAIALATSYFSLKFRNILVNLGASAAWAVVLAFFLQNTAHATWKEMFILDIAAFICAFALLSMFNRNGESIVKGFTGVGNRENDKDIPEPKSRGIMGMDEDEYKAYLHGLRTRGQSRRR